VVLEDRLPSVLRERRKNRLQCVHRAVGEIGGVITARNSLVVGGELTPGLVKPLLTVWHRPAGLSLIEEGGQPLRENPVKFFAQVIGLALDGRFSRNHLVQKRLGVAAHAVGRTLTGQYVRVDPVVVPGLPEDRGAGVAATAEQLSRLRNGPLEGLLLEARQGVCRDKRVQRPN
jgi:hypothetical protein